MGGGSGGGCSRRRASSLGGAAGRWRGVGVAGIADRSPAWLSGPRSCATGPASRCPVLSAPRRRVGRLSGAAPIQPGSYNARDCLWRLAPASNQELASAAARGLRRSIQQRLQLALGARSAGLASAERSHAGSGQATCQPPNSISSLAPPHRAHNPRPNRDQQQPCASCSQPPLQRRSAPLCWPAAQTRCCCGPAAR